jgi:hypothetical protein
MSKIEKADGSEMTIWHYRVSKQHERNQTQMEPHEMLYNIAVALRGEKTNFPLSNNKPKPQYLRMTSIKTTNSTSQNTRAAAPPPEETQQQQFQQPSSSASPTTTTMPSTTSTQLTTWRSPCRENGISVPTDSADYGPA